jgi:hypothetical protein
VQRVNVQHATVFSQGEHKVRLTRNVALNSWPSVSDIAGLKKRRANTRFAPTASKFLIAAPGGIILFPSIEKIISNGPHVRKELS